MGLFGGGHSSSSSSSTQVDKRQVFGDGGTSAMDGGTVIGAGGINAGAQSIINMTDGRAFDVVDSVIGRQMALTKDLTSQAFNGISQEANIVSAAYADAKGRGANTDKILMLSVVAVAVVAWAALKGKK